MSALPFPHRSHGESLCMLVRMRVQWFAESGQLKALRILGLRQVVLNLSASAKRYESGAPTPKRIRGWRPGGPTLAAARKPGKPPRRGPAIRHRATFYALFAGLRARPAFHAIPPPSCASRVLGQRRQAHRAVPGTASQLGRSRRAILVSMPRHIGRSVDCRAGCIRHRSVSVVERHRSGSPGGQPFSGHGRS